jgi:hypothetical protein
LILGGVVNDVVHLLAELIENATAYSPPNTPVQVRADSVGNGFAVEIEDRGLGLRRPDQEQINRRLADPPEFDPARSEQLGLFVVAQLAARHGIKVSLRESPFAGTTAIVLLPRALLVPSGEQADPPARNDMIGIVAAQALAHALTGATQPLPAAEPPLSAPRREISPDSRNPDQPIAGIYRGLPRRARLASLAPELRAAPKRDDTRPASSRPATRSSEDTQSMLSALQQGWLRGRADNLDEEIP